MAGEDTEEEKFFRENYAHELQKKKQDRGRDELDDERKRVNSKK
jgi:hypothetical protein